MREQLTGLRHLHLHLLQQLRLPQRMQLLRLLLQLRALRSGPLLLASLFLSSALPLVLKLQQHWQLVLRLRWKMSTVMVEVLIKDELMMCEETKPCVMSLWAMVMGDGKRMMDARWGGHDWVREEK